MYKWSEGGSKGEDNQKDQNKKVLLRERKRRTTSGVCCPGRGGEGGPLSWLGEEVQILQTLLVEAAGLPRQGPDRGTPLADQEQDRGYAIPSSLARTRTVGYPPPPPPPGLGQGVLPFLPLAKTRPGGTTPPPPGEQTENITFPSYNVRGR